MQATSQRNGSSMRRRFFLNQTVARALAAQGAQLTIKGIISSTASFLL